MENKTKSWIHTLFAYAQDEKKKLGESVVLSVLSIVAGLALEQLAEHVSFVAQDNFLFGCSIMENIRLGNPKATDEEVKAAARAAQCEAFIEKLPDGYNTPAGEAGKRLSGGEKQRIVIAHRLSTIKSADQIVVLQNGQIEAIGTQEQLLIDSPLYQKMWKAHVGAKNWAVSVKCDDNPGNITEEKEDALYV